MKNPLTTLRTWFTPDSEGTFAGQAVRYVAEAHLGDDFVKKATSTTDPMEHLRYAYFPEEVAGKEVQDDLLLALLENPNVKTLAVFSRCLAYPNEIVRSDAITHPNLPAELLAEHLRRLDPTVNPAFVSDFEAAKLRQAVLVEDNKPLEKNVVAELKTRGFWN